jgi:hypothetical protein
MSGQGQVIDAPSSSSGRHALRCGVCQGTEKFRRTSTRRVFCSICQSLLLDPTPQARRTSRPRPSVPKTRRQPAKAGAVANGAHAPWRKAESLGPERLIGMEKHIKAIGIWYRLVGVLGALACIVAGALTGSVVSLLGLVFCLPPLFIGHYLTKYQNWARWTVVVLTGLGSALNIGSVLFAGAAAAGVVFPLLWNAAVLVVLLNSASAGIFTADYRNEVARTPGVSVPFWTSPFFFVPVAIFFVGLMAAFGGMLR